MNTRCITFELEVAGCQVEEAVASIFHTVLFHRSLGKFIFKGDGNYSIGTIGYEDIDCNFIDLTYVCCSSKALGNTLKQGTSGFSQALSSIDGPNSGQISLEFFQKKKSRWPFEAESIPWETWNLHFTLINHEHYHNEHVWQALREKVGYVLAEKIMNVTQVVNRPDFVPEMPNHSELDLIFDTSYPDLQPYLFKFTYTTEAAVTYSIGNTLRKIVQGTLTFQSY